VRPHTQRRRVWRRAGGRRWREQGRRDADTGRVSAGRSCGEGRSEDGGRRTGDEAVRCGRNSCTGEASELPGRRQLSAPLRLCCRSASVRRYALQSSYQLPEHTHINSFCPGRSSSCLLLPSRNRPCRPATPPVHTHARCGRHVSSACCLSDLPSSVDPCLRDMDA
jgi:hypothetical protein